MQEIKKRRIVLASVLKPANEPRMFEKLGQSLVEDFEVHCIGRNGQTIEGNPDLQTHALPSFKRISLFRVIVPLIILKRIIALRPSLVIICTHELLFVAIVAKIFAGCSIIYDVQENYYRNILYGNSFFFYLRPVVAAYVRCKEWISVPFIDHYFLAEKGYEEEINFVGAKKTVLENKVKKSVMPLPAKKRSRDGDIHLLFSGTLAKTTGVFTAVDMAKKLHDSDRRIRLTIIGYSTVSRTIQTLKKEIEGHSFIQLVGGHTFVPHTDILSAIQSSDFGIIAYPPNPSTQNSMPTKLFEYLGFTLPILLIDHPAWVERCRSYPAAIPFSPDTIDAPAILRAMQQRTFYSKLPEDVYWESEVSKLLQTIGQLLPIST